MASRQSFDLVLPYGIAHGKARGRPSVSTRLAALRGAVVGIPRNKGVSIAPANGRIQHEFHVSSGLLDWRGRAPYARIKPGGCESTAGSLEGAGAATRKSLTFIESSRGIWTDCLGCIRARSPTIVEIVKRRLGEVYPLLRVRRFASGLQEGDANNAGDANLFRLD